LASVFSAFVAFRTRWGRACGRRLTSAPALALAAAIAVVAPTAACSGSGASTRASAPRAASPAITAVRARQVWDQYVAAAAQAAPPHSAPPVLSLVTGVERAVLSAALGRHSVTVSGSPSSATGAYHSSLTVKPALSAYTYGPPTFFLPEAAGYPRFFVVSATRTAKGTTPAGAATAELGGARVPLNGPALMLFSRASAGAPWLLASASPLASGVTLPKLAADGAGYVPTVPLSDTALLARPDDAGPLQAAVVDDGPASTATRAVADGPLTTGMYQGVRDHADNMTPPTGDVYQWELEGVNVPEFALRTAAGGALVFYAMSLNTTVAVPDYVNKADPVHSGPPIQVPVSVRMLLPPGQPAPLIQLSSVQQLSFAAVDPAPGKAKIQVIALGGGLTSASAT
jgi:hypothetical protein